MMANSFRKYLPGRENLILIGYLVGISLSLYLAFSERAYDDPFITYRYARNLRQGLGMVYNPGERVLSTTTPGFTLLLAGLSYLWSDLRHLANLLGVISIAAGGAGLWVLGRTWKSPWLAWAGLLLYPTIPLLVNTLGSETPLYLALGIWTYVLYHRGRYHAAVLLAALTILLRSDGILIPLLLLVHYLWQHRTRLLEPAFWKQQPWWSVILALLLLAGWHTFAWLYFGAPLPVTLAAKQQQGAMLISTPFAAGFLRVAGWYAKHWHYWVEALLVFAGIVMAVRKVNSALAFLSWAGLYFLAYSLLGVSTYFWYYTPLVPGWVVAVGLGLAWWANVPVWKRILPTRFWQMLPAALLLTGLVAGQLYHLDRERQHPDLRYGIYRAVGEWIAENTPEDAQVGVLEVGIIGFYSQRPMVDFAGLIQPEVAEQLTVEATYEDAALWAVAEYQPEVIVLVEGSFPRLRADYLTDRCGLAKVFPAEAYDFPADLEVYTCVPSLYE